MKKNCKNDGRFGNLRSYFNEKRCIYIVCKHVVLGHVCTVALAHVRSFSLVVACRMCIYQVCYIVILNKGPFQRNELFSKREMSFTVVALVL